MKAVIQRTGKTSLSVDSKLISEIPFGLTVYFGVEVGDTEKQAEAFAKKIVRLRIFEDENGKMNKSVIDVKGEILFVSQFTLLADCSHGNRPDFIAAERPEKAELLYERTAELMRGYGVTVKTGVFGADMKISQYNDGPVTIVYEI